MIVEWICGETGFHWNLLKRSTDPIDFGAIRKSKARPSRSEAAEQADEPRGEERNANSDAHFQRPWRHFDKERQNENGDGRPEKNRFFLKFFSPASFCFPNVPAG